MVFMNCVFLLYLLICVISQNWESNRNLAKWETNDIKYWNHPDLAKFEKLSGSKVLETSSYSSREVRLQKYDPFLQKKTLVPDWKSLTFTAQKRRKVFLVVSVTKSYGHRCQLCDSNKLRYWVEKREKTFFQ